MASVAADPSAIAPPLPPPARSDAAQPAGPSSAFADLLDAAAPATASQPQSGSTSRADDGSNGAQRGAAAGNGTDNADPAGAGATTQGSRNAKTAGTKNTDDQSAPGDGGAPVSNAAADVAVVVGLALPPFALAPLPNADQTTAAPQDEQHTSTDPAQPSGGDGTAQPGERKDASASSDVVPAALAAALPNVPIAAAVPVSPLASPIPVRSSSPVTAPTAAAVFSASSTSVSAVGADVTGNSPSEPQTDGTTPPSPKPVAAAQDMLPGQPPMLAAPPPPADEFATAVLPALPQATAGAGVSDQTGKSAGAAPPVITPASSGTLSPAIAVAPPNAVPPTPLSGEIHIADQPAALAREPENIPLPLPAQVAVRFAPAVHTGDDNDANRSDSGTDILTGFAGGGEAGGATATNSGQVGAAITPSFNPAVPTAMQAASAAPVAPQHAAGVPSAVPLAGIPIAIVARAEAGEKKFEIRLDPPDLGRIEVQLNVDSSGRATSHLIVDRADTLDLLRRDAPALERALQSAGLTTDEGALQFSLRDQSFAGRDQGAPAAFTPAPPAAADTDLAPIDTALRRYGPPMGLGGGIDIRV